MMILSDAVAKLATLIPALKSNDAKFASDLIASYKKYGGLTPKQEPWIERLIARAAAPVVSAPAAVNVGGFAGVVALFNKAKESGLKFPKIRLSLNGVKVTLSVNGPKSKAPGFISINGEGTYPNRAYYGRVSPAGEFTPFKAGLPGLTELLTELASNPARVAKEHGKLTGNCCFCGKEVGYGKEKRSVLVGFGPDCAENYGLKAEWLAGVAKAEAKASVPVLSVQDEAKASLEAGFVAKAPTPETAAAWAASVSNPYPADEQAVGVPDFVPVIKPIAEVLKVALPTVEELANAPVSEEFQTTGLTPAEIASEAKLDSYGENPGDLGDYAPASNPVETVYEQAEPVACFFCETVTADYKTLHGFTVCSACVAQLK